MSDILGHDINGRPLRVGDKVVLVEVTNPYSSFWSGQELTILRAAGVHERVTMPGTFGDYFNPVEKESYRAEYVSTRKITDDHCPADESFTDMMNKLKSPDRVTG